MKKNIHPIERMARITGGALLTSLAFWGPKNKIFLMGLIPMTTGSVGTCPLYSTLKISSNPKDAQLTDSRTYFHPVGYGL